MFELRLAFQQLIVHYSTSFDDMNNRIQEFWHDISCFGPFRFHGFFFFFAKGRGAGGGGGGGRC